MKRLHGQLRDGGYLFLGHAETLWQISDDFALVSLGDAFVYRRLDEEVATSERRAVLPDRRTEDDLRPTRADRRHSDDDRRGAAAAVTVTVPTPSRDPLDAVRSALSEGRYDEAADVAAEVVAATPLWAQAHYLQGVALTNLGRDADALVVLRKAIYLEPEHAFAHFLLGGALERQGEPVAASRSYRAAATTLGSRPLDVVAPELGGRSTAELAALCIELAHRADQNSRA
jgi:chemotaxis protein methyltransferase CheR